MVRKLNVWPFGVILEESFKVFVDSRDVGPIILTHLYLLTGCTVPLWLGAPSTNMESKYTETCITESRSCETICLQRSYLQTVYLYSICIHVLVKFPFTLMSLSVWPDFLNNLEWPYFCQIAPTKLEIRLPSFSAMIRFGREQVRSLGWNPVKHKTRSSTVESKRSLKLVTAPLFIFEILKFNFLFQVYTWFYLVPFYRSESATQWLPSSDLDSAPANGPGLIKP